MLLRWRHGSRRRLWDRWATWWRLASKDQASGIGHRARRYGGSVLSKAATGRGAPTAGSAASVNAALWVLRPTACSRTSRHSAWGGNFQAILVTIVFTISQFVYDWSDHDWSFPGDVLYSLGMVTLPRWGAVQPVIEGCVVGDDKGGGGNTRNQDLRQRQGENESQGLLL